MASAAHARHARSRGRRAGDALTSALDPRRPALLTWSVADLGRSLEFFLGLGIPLRLRGEGIAELQSEGVQLVLVQDRSAADPAPSAGPALAWEVADLDAARSELQGLGIACEDLAPPAGVDPAIHGRRLRFRDPDGHPLEIVSWP